MKNGSISDQIKMQEHQISDERRVNECSQVGIYTDKQAEITDIKQENKQSVR